MATREQHRSRKNTLHLHCSHMHSHISTENLCSIDNAAIPSTSKEIVKNYCTEDDISRQQPVREISSLFSWT